MPDLFSARELIDVAIREEETGATYYRAVADATDSDELADFMRSVAAMEDEHAEKFRGLRERVGEFRPTGEGYGGEYESYMAYMLEGRIFPAGDEGVALAKRQEDERRAIDTAMELERNTLLFYQEMLKFIPEPQQNLLDDIIAEERQHLIGWANFRKRNA